MRTKILIPLLFSILLLSSCSGLRVVEHETWSGVNSYELTDGKQSIRYFKSSCPFPAETLDAIVEQITAGVVVWLKMENYDYRDRVLKEECARQIILHSIKK